MTFFLKEKLLPGLFLRYKFVIMIDIILYALEMDFCKKGKVPIVIGVTGSGKTDFSFKSFCGGAFEFLNIDSAQFLSFVSVATARPSVQDFQGRSSHFFGFLDESALVSSFSFVPSLEERLKLIKNNGKFPVIVGGSHFYVYSLFFKRAASEDFSPAVDCPVDLSWNTLNSILPQRAASVHVNDLYRIKNSILAYYANGEMPKIIYFPSFDYVVLHKLPPDDLLVRLKDRISDFFSSYALFDEVLSLSQEQMYLLLRKKIIGYEEILNFIFFFKKSLGGRLDVGELMVELRKNASCFAASILSKTLRYVKKQKKFINKLKRDLSVYSVEWRDV
jgi:tRNA A37 N6-isopentenylltransferase MiaA